MSKPVEAPVILVVDDDPGVRHVLAQTLAQDGFTVLQAVGGREAVTLYGSQPGRIGLVLLDVCMPVLDGPETLAALREADPAVVCCFMSGYTDDYSPDQLVGMGAVGVLEKPFRFDQLGRTLRAMMKAKAGGIGTNCAET